MIRNLHLKLVLILVLLIVSVMMVVGTYLINGVSMFYINDFGNQMSGVFKQEFYDTLRLEGSEQGGLERMESILYAYSGLLGINNNRHYYILEGSTGAYLAGNEQEENSIEITSNILSAMNGSIGIGNSIADSCIDFALPVMTDEATYIVYIRDNKSELGSLTNIIFLIIVQAMLFGLIIAVALSFILSKAITNPVENLTRSAKRIARGDFSEISQSSSRDEIGTLTNTFNDMAKRLKSTINDVEEERNKLATLFLHMTDGMAAFDRAGRLININPSAEKLLGRALGEDDTYAGVLGEAGVEMGEIFEIEPPGYIETELSFRDRVLKVYLAPFGRDENDGGVMAVIHDVTEQAKLEAARREFVANVSHELRTPLTNVKSYTETLISDEEIPSKMRERFLRVILNETDRMAHIVKDLLTLTRMDYGRLDWNFEPINTVQLFEEIAEAMRGEASLKGHSLILRLGEGLPSITGDRDRLQQAVANLISNAIKYTPDDGKITIDVYSSGGNLSFCVTDNGLGIPKEDIPRLFERFYRVDKGRSREMGGTGLGLSIAKDIIDHHKGTIEVKSGVGEGTSITVTLPAGLPETA
jgi:two-component system sensor histidine kinase VicK